MFTRPVIKIVNGIKNSMISTCILTISKADKAKVIEWPSQTSV